ncbi:MAG: hypothetical protein KGI41_02255 [Patescibacteria group bacterium]|nr:hypothetical protein [Patescibacteria group bacterium]MDE1966036.1 hypothetical protein [Patescibacteria group bacterium]
MSADSLGLSPQELRVLCALDTPIKIQDFLDAIPMNFEKGKDTHQSPRRVLKERRAHCIEGALLAAAALWLHGEPPLLMDLKAREGRGDDDHVVALYKRGGHWGLISKTNHATIRFRDPVYRTPRELALSYFHEWFMNANGEKTLESYSRLLDLSRFGTAWVTAQEDLWWLDEKLDALTHYPLVPKGNRRFIRRADPMELKAGRLIEWKESDPRT